MDDDKVIAAGGCDPRQLNDGTQIPALGLGTAPLDDAASEIAVRDGLEIGYRLIDTGAVYGNERGVGLGVRTSGLPREQVQVISKVRGRDHGYEPTLRAFEESRRRLGLDYVDLYLIHWPNPHLDRFVDTWRALIHLREQGLVRSIGVSNFTAELVARLADETGVLPAVNQIEVHPGWQQVDLRRALTEQGVQVLCYSPLGRGGGVLAHPALLALATEHRVSAAQVVLRWHVQQGLIPLPRASGPERRRENFDVCDLVLTPDEMRALARVPQLRTGFDPHEHEEL